ncbi:tRNA (adenosine(37)-N6)-threonylcarbamoyltransferase complex transferase subunit TsaD [Hirschia maritima]|uniref:tRNA (adenosine(37)-N6)-threonylcarbamoyltransferase complex transferase subunit TsaD n=1 Tax=Hirschia maritima TaxID=1121961 RepID=UPI00035D54CB|nr:tRNA (adenosine(37)-N6)-threonylcarbamoyltransferase complex transferase subunit TsaD [Hirschia maritima]
MTQDTLKMPEPSIILGLESSCDETAAALVRRLDDGNVEVLSERIASQDDKHEAFGGVVPEIAARAHVERMDGLVKEVMDEAKVSWNEIGGVAATSGPGLIGGVLVGLMTGKAISLAQDIPFMAVNHLEGHALSPRLTGKIEFPYLLLLVSGGHCQFLLVKNLGEYERLGSTIDDAPGEAFDKTAKLMGLGFPGGPAVERWSEKGDKNAVDLPRPLLKKKDTLDMSFAGLKTAVRRAVELEPINDQRKADICASFQLAVADILAKRSEQAMRLYKERLGSEVCQFVVAGGVAANKSLRARLEISAAQEGFTFASPPMKWCTDNAAMIALVGLEKFERRQFDDLDVNARARWPLDSAAASASPAYGGGRRGAKA